MKNKWKSLRLGVMLFALPVVATAAASANQWMIENAPVAASAEMTAIFGTINAQRGHTIALNESGNVEGRIAAITAGSKANGLSDLQVVLIEDGKVRYKAQTDADGLFALTGVEEGVYSFIASGDNGFAAYGVRVVESAGDNSFNLIEAAAVSTKTSVVKQLINGELPSQAKAVAIADTTVSENAASIAGANKVMITEGTLVGRVMQMLNAPATSGGTSVYIIKNNQMVAETLTDAKGNFSVSNLEPGVYDFVAAGQTGFAAVSFEAVSSEDVASLASDGEIPVSIEPATLANASPSLDVYTTLPAVGGTPVETTCNTCNTCNTCPSESPIEYAGESVGCGCAAGGSGGAAGNFSGFNTSVPRGRLFGGNGPLSGGGGPLGGGGGLFGGGPLASLGGLGRLALLGGAATAIAVSADDDDGPTPPSPSTTAP